MSVPLTINGVTFQYPQENDKHWGPVLTNWSTAVTNGMLQKAGGSFHLTAEVDFGTAFGIKVLSIKYPTGNIGSTGFLRLPNAAQIVWRNAIGNADLVLTVDASNQLLFNGVPIGATSSLTDGHIYVGNALNQPADVAMTGDITITNTGVTAIGAGKVTNTMIQTAAGIALNKLAALAASQIAVTDGSGFLTSVSTPTITELSYVGGATSNLQAQIDAIAADVITNTPVGSMLDFAGSSAPSGWLVCNGSVISQTTYASLYAVIGSTWNTGGEGAGNFRLPDFRRRVAVGSGGSGTGTLGNSVGDTGGAETVALSTAEMPSHTHSASVTDPGHAHVEKVYVAGGGSFKAVGSSSATSGGSTFNADFPGSTADNTTGITVSNSSTGSGNAHNNIQPSAIVTKIIKY